MSMPCYYSCTFDYGCFFGHTVGETNEDLKALIGATQAFQVQKIGADQKCSRFR